MRRSVFAWPQDARPVIRQAVRMPFSPDSVRREYRHATYALHQHHYEGRVWLAGRWHDLRPGDMTITPPEEVSRYELKEAGFHWCIHFDPVAIPPGAAVLRLPWHLATRGGEGQERMRQITEWVRGRKGREAGLATAAASVMLQELLMMLALGEADRRTKTRRDDRRSDRELDAARERIEEEFPRELSVADLAEGSGLSRNYFSARFRARFGRTPQSYLLHRRIEAARLLLATTNLPIKEVGFECGLPDAHHFNKQFRLLTGMNPSVYRARQAGKW